MVTDFDKKTAFWSRGMAGFGKVDTNQIGFPSGEPSENRMAKNNNFFGEYLALFPCSGIVAHVAMSTSFGIERLRMSTIYIYRLTIPSAIELRGSAILRANYPFLRVILLTTVSRYLRFFPASICFSGKICSIPNMKIIWLVNPWFSPRFPHPKSTKFSTNDIKVGN